MVSIAISPIDLSHDHKYLPLERQLRMKREERSEQERDTRSDKDAQRYCLCGSFILLVWSIYIASSSY